MVNKIIQFRSVRVSQWVSLIAVLLLAFLTIFNSYIHNVIQSAEERYHRIMQVQNSFGELRSLESAVLTGSEHYATFLAASQSILIDIETEPEYLNASLMKERGYVFNKLLSTSSENQKYFEYVTETLPELITNVRSIHEFHIANLKETLQTGNQVREVDVSENFERSPVRSAPELDIINAAIAVQNNLLAIVALFSDMQEGHRHTNIEELFSERINSFYKSVNDFDDFSLDSQDGLLVEELLITGKKFTKSFGNILKNNKRITLLKLQVLDNERGIKTQFNDALSKSMKKKAQLIWQLSFIQKTITVITLVLAGWLLFYGVHLSRQFARTARETQKIQGDLTYRVQNTSSGYEEFRLIHDTLNTLADTAESQVKALELMKGDLTKRVHERTSELVHMNTRLKNEIADRVKADESRRDLENKLIRAKKMEAVGTLAGGVAHDLNNILSGVVSYPELILLDMQKNDPLYNSILTIKNSGEKAASIVQDLLTLARRGVAISEVFDLGQLIREYLRSPEFMHLKDEHKGVEVALEIDDDCGNIRGSRLHMLKTVMNLVTNGMEAMPDGGTLRLVTRSVYIDTQLKGYDTVKEGDYVSFTVIDNGVGMSMEVSEQIFEPFFTQKKMGRSGTGLGMAVVYSTVKDHGGYIDIQSTPGAGSKITMYLPLTREVESEKVKSGDLSSLIGDNEHVLIVDDVYEQRQIAASMLKRLNYTVATAAGGEEAVEYIKDNDVDIVVLDMIMPPGMDGLDTFLALQAVKPDVKVVIASGYSESDRVVKAQEMGAGRYVRKPYSLEMLGSAIHDGLKVYHV